MASGEMEDISLPSAQPEQKWIPCSEKLPDVGQDVLFSVMDMYAAEGCLPASPTVLDPEKAC